MRYTFACAFARNRSAVQVYSYTLYNIYSSFMCLIFNTALFTTPYPPLLSSAFSEPRNKLNQQRTRQLPAPTASSSKLKACGHVPRRPLGRHHLYSADAEHPFRGHWPVLGAREWLLRVKGVLPRAGRERREELERLLLCKGSRRAVWRCARVVAGRYYKGQQISTTLIRFLDSWRSCRSCTPKMGRNLVSVVLICCPL